MDTENNEVVETQQETTQEPVQSDSLLGNSVELGEGEWLLYDGVKGVGEKPDYFNSDKFKTLADQAKGHSELHKMVGSFTGAPKEGYKLDESIDKDDPLTSAVLDFAQESNMSQDKLEKLLEIGETLRDVNKEIDQEAELAKLGDNASQRITQLDTALKNKLGDGYQEVADLVTTADQIILAEKLMQAYAPAKLPIDGGEHPQGLTLSEIEAASNKIDEVSGRPLRSVDPAYNKKVEQMFRDYAGDGDHKLVIG